MNNLNGDNLINQIYQSAILLTDKEIKKHFSRDTPDVFRKSADRIDKAFKRDKDETETKTE